MGRFYVIWMVSVRTQRVVLRLATLQGARGERVFDPDVFEVSNERPKASYS